MLKNYKITSTLYEIQSVSIKNEQSSTLFEQPPTRPVNIEVECLTSRKDFFSPLSDTAECQCERMFAPIVCTLKGVDWLYVN